MEIIDNILRIMDERKISKYNVAKHCDFQNNLWAYWQSGRQKPGLTTLIKIADYFNVSLDYLVGREATATIAETQQNTANNVTIAPLLNRITELNELQQAKVMAYIDGLQGADNAIENAFNRGQKEEQAKELKGGVIEKIKKSI